MRFPSELTIHGSPPPPNPKHYAKGELKGEPIPCSICDRLYEDHTGRLCAICRGPIEHHDADSLAFEVAACARLSEARSAGGHALRPHEVWCLANVDKEIAA